MHRSIAVQNYGSTSPAVPRGNITTKIQRCFPIAPATQTCSDATTTYSYDETGQIITKVDPNGNQITYSYVDNFFSTDTGSFTNTSGAPPSGQVTDAYVTQITLPTTNGVSHINRCAYGFINGELTESIDENGQISTYQYNDWLGQPNGTSYPDGGQVTISYNDAPTTPSATTTRLVSSGVSITNVSVKDGMEHETQKQLTSDPDGTDYTDTTYDGLGLVWKRSNPHRTAASSTDGTTTFYYDALGRECLKVPPDGTQPPGAMCPATRPTGDVLTVYSGNCATVTDEAGKSRKSCSDAFGRITQAFEDPSGVNYETDYTYNALGSLLSTNQKGSAPTDSTQWRTRTYTYDSLGRVSTAIAPESGTGSYIYDANSNVLSRTSPQPNQTGSATITTNYTYDALGRLTGKTYVGMGSAGMSYGYDGVAPSGCTPPTLSDSYPISHRTSMCDGAGASSWSHDKMGRVASVLRTTSGVTKGISYGYNLDGSVASVTRPSGRVLNYSYAPSGTANSAGRTILVVDPSGPVNYVTQATYAPPGELTTALRGAAISISNSYNSRLQPISNSAVAASTIVSLNYNFGLGVGDNGTVHQIVNNRDGNRTQNFLYDSLNRIQQAYTNGPNWGETSSPNATSPGVAPSSPGIDAWGNLTNRSGVTGKNSYEPLSCPANSSNQLATCSLVYDAAGNVMTYASTSYTYDAENRLTNTAGYTSVYDGDGNRVNKHSSAATTLYWYGVDGETVSESDGSGGSVTDYIFFNHQRVARRGPTGDVHYYFSDHLGSHSVVTDANGTMPPQAESDYYPYGGEIPITTGDSNHYKFTAKERDSETCSTTCLDNFGARHNASGFGRFMSADPVTILPGRLGDPQQLNLYAYARNNPLRFVDPTGMIIDDASCMAIPQCARWELEFKKSRRGQLLWKQIDDDPKLLVHIKWDPNATDSEATDYKWDSSGKLVAATLVLTKNSADMSKHMLSEWYPFGTTLTERNERIVYVIGHELAHIEDADTPQGRANIKQINELAPIRDAFERAARDEGRTYYDDEYWKAYGELINKIKTRNENVADQRAKGVVESYRACTSNKEVCQ